MDEKKRKEGYEPLLKSLRPRILTADPGEVLFRGQKEKDLIGLVQEGLLYLCVENEQLQRHILCFFRPGDYFSLDMLIPVSQGFCYFVTRKASRIACFSREDLLSLAGRVGGEKGPLAPFMGGRMERELLLHSFMLQSRSIRGKLLSFFRQESVLQQTNPFQVPIPFSDLADYLAVDRSAMMKEIKRMKEEGFLSGKNRTLSLAAEEGGKA